tara:strand:+ start:83973 stop:84671 length:699 start_codon:yes stop_codon:yes gene_type:complete
MSSQNYQQIKTIGFDADDTLWINETFFRDGEKEFAKLLTQFETENKILQEIYRYEIKNLDLYGYGVKGFVLSMIECALEVSNHQINSKLMEEILEIGKRMLAKPVELLPGVIETLEALQPKYRLLLLTKGDLLDQERKLEKSGLTKYFHHVEVLSNKKEKNYKDLLDHLLVPENEFLMIGNSLKSDVLPVINIGGEAIHVPFHTTWEHERVEKTDQHNYQTIDSLLELKMLL